VRRLPLHSDDELELDDLKQGIVRRTPGAEGGGGSWEVERKRRIIRRRVVFGSTCRIS
jgi:hypothetical protein